MSFGYQDSKFEFIQFPEGQTANRLRGLTNRLNIGYMEFLTRLDGAMASLAAGDPLINMLTFKTTEDSFTSGGPSEKVWQRSGEYGIRRPQRGLPGRGYYIPLYHYEIALGFTDRALQTMTVPKFEDELRTTVQAVARGHRADVLERLFSDAIFPLDDAGNGTSPGFAGTGSNADAFVGVLPSGSPTASNYTHYHSATDTDGTIDTMLKAMRDKLDLWNKGPYDLIAPSNVVERIMQIAADDTQFVSAGSTLVRPGTTESEAMVDPTQYLGVYGGWIRIRYPDDQINGDNFAIVKSYGSGAYGNPVAERYDEIYGESAYVDDRHLVPLTNGMIMQSYGHGVGNRVGAALGHIGAGGTYVAPTIYR